MKRLVSKEDSFLSTRVYNRCTPTCTGAVHPGVEWLYTRVYKGFSCLLNSCFIGGNESYLPMKWNVSSGESWLMIGCIRHLHRCKFRYRWRKSCQYIEAGFYDTDFLSVYKRLFFSSSFWHTICLHRSVRFKESLCGRCNRNRTNMFLE